MEKLIWVIGDDKKEMIEAQRRINANGSMRAVCMLSEAAVLKAISNLSERQSEHNSSPSLIVFDYEMSVEQDFYLLSIINKQQVLAGVPRFFMAEVRNEAVDEDCYMHGATVVVHKPFSNAGISRMERTSWQYEVTKNYEKMLQKQADDLQASREISILNKQLEEKNGQLESRNELLHQIFGRYFSDDVVDFILKNPEGASVGGNKMELTVMMADLRGFTSISENMEPVALTKMLNCFFGKMVDVISTYHGTIIEFLGDAILAVFGAPIVNINHIENAIAAAIGMQNAMLEVNAFCEKEGYPQLEMGIGLHCGEAFLGNIGSEKMMRYNVLGGVINECSRIEGYSVGGQVLISEDTLKRAKVPVTVKTSMTVSPKGLKRTITICDVVGIAGDYQCALWQGEEQELIDVTDNSTVLLFWVDEKRVSAQPVKAFIKAVSKQELVVELDSRHNDLELLTDFEVLAQSEDGDVLFARAYAKVMKQMDNLWSLRFTHINKSVEQYVDGLGGENK